MQQIKVLHYKNFFFWQVFYHPFRSCLKSLMNGPYVGAENLQPLPFVWFMDFLDSPTRKVKWLLQCTVVIFLTIYFSHNIWANEKILIAAASDLNFAMEEICHAFEKSNPTIHVDVSYGSSGNFYAQIKQCAPFDLFFSADASYPVRLEEEGLAIMGQRQLYAIGKIVLWIPKKSSLNPQKGLNIVLEPDVKKLAIANPKHAPYGKAAEEALRYYGLWDKVQSKLVLGENVSQTAQFVQAGAADAGIIALSLAVSPKMADEGNYWIIPGEAYNKLEQVYTVLQRGKDKSGVKTFLKFLQGEKVGKILADYGFILPK